MSIANPYLEKNLEENGLNVSPEDARLRRNATYFSVSVAAILIVTKFYAFLITDSVSLLSSLMDSSLDLVASLLTLMSVRHAVTPADSTHRFGHGKLEPLTALGQAFFIGASSIFILFEALTKFADPEPVSHIGVGISVMSLSIVLTIVLVLFQTYTVRKTKSLAIAADSLHYKGDLLMNVGVILALLLVEYTNWPYFDPIFAIIVSAILAHSAWQMGTGSAHILMDGELPPEDREKIRKIVTAHSQVVTIHDLRTRSSGTQIFIEFHLEIDGNLTLKAAHDITEDLERVLYEAFPTSEVLIHPEPAGIDDHRIDDVIEES